MSTTLRFPKVVALDGFGVQTPVPADATIVERTIGAARVFDILDNAGADLALLGRLDISDLMQRAPIGLTADDWCVLRVSMEDEDGTPAACQLDVGALLDDAAGAVFSPLNAGATGLALGPRGTASLSRDNIYVYPGQALLFAEGAAGGPWDIMITLMQVSARSALMPTGLIGAPSA